MREPQYIPIDGKVVALCVKFQDEAGYDTLSIRFTDGTRIMVKEEGQSGHFSVAVASVDIGRG